MRRRRHSQAPPLSHSQAPRSPPFPAPVKAPPLSPHCSKGPAPNMLIGLGRRDRRSGIIGAAERYWCQTEETAVGAELDLQEGLLLRPIPFSSEERFRENPSPLRGSHSPAKRDTDAEFAPWGFLFCSLSATVLSPSHPPGSSERIPDSQESSRSQQNTRIKSFIVFRAIVIGLGRWDDSGGTSQHLTVAVDGDCRGGWRP